MLFYRGRQRILDSNGDPVSGAKLNFYLTGTTTRADTYTDSDLTTEHANPVIASSAGFVEPIYLDPTVTYKCVITTSNDVALPDGTVDPVSATLDADTIGEVLYPTTGSAAEVAAAVTIVNHAYNYGVVNRYGTNTTPGTTDMTAATVAALSVAHNGLGKAIALGETYLVGNIDWPGNNITLEGSGSAYSYNTSANPKTVFKAKAATTIVFDLLQTGLAEDRTGNHIVDLEIDGNSIAAVGIDCAGSNVIERCRVIGCSTAGVRLSNFTNSSRIVHCGLNSNSGWGLHATGVSTTTYSVVGSNISLNTLGGMLIEAGVLAAFRDNVIESNTGPGVKINRVTSHTNEFSNLEFDNCWLEDNASASPYFSLVIDSELPGDSSKHPNHIRFRGGNITCSSVTRKYMNLNVCNNVTFENVRFSGSTEAAALTLTSDAIRVAFLECATRLVSGGITAAQMDAAIAAGTLCYSSDRDIKRVVGAGAPAAAFQNSWANNGGGYATAKYWHDRDGNVCLEGSVDSGSTGTVAFTLPVGYRPASSMVFAIDANGAHGTATIGTDGTVTLAAASTANTHLNGIKFQKVTA